MFKISDFRVQILDIGERRQDFRFRIQDLRFPGNCRIKVGRKRVLPPQFCRRLSQRKIFPQYEPENQAFLKADLPAKRAAAPNSSSMAIRRLNLAIRSLLEAEPVLILPDAVATARSAMVVSSVSPER